jgi:integrase
MWNDNQIKAMPAKDRRYRVAEPNQHRGRGRLVLDIYPSGHKDFYFQYFNSESKRKYTKIGSFKKSAKDPGYTLAEARDKMLELTDIHKQGFDVQNYREERRLNEQDRIRQIEATKRQGSCEQLLDSYLTAMDIRGKRSRYYVERSLTRYVKTPFPELLKLKANEIQPKQIGLILRRMIDNGITTHTNRVRSYLHAAFQHGIKQDNDPRRYAVEGIMFNLTSNPVSSIPRQADFERVGDHVINENEIPVIWNELPKKSIVAACAVKLALTNGQRLGELVRLKLTDFDLDERTMLIPASVSKNGIDHLVPLDDLSLSVVKELKNIDHDSEYAFPGLRGGKYRGHINNTTVAGFVREFCEENDKVSKFVPRDIRRTVKTLMGKAGVSKELRDRIQNHALTDVSSKHYDRYDYLAEKRHGLNVWNDYLELIINPHKKVTHISKRA